MRRLNRSILLVQQFPDQLGVCISLHFRSIGLVVGISRLVRRHAAALRLELLQDAFNVCFDLVHPFYLLAAVFELLFHHHNERFTGLMGAVKIEKVMRVDKQVAQILYFGFKLFWGY